MKATTFPRMHVSLYVSNIQQTVQFYTAFFGLEPEKVKAGYAKWHLEQPALIISFVENAERVQPGFGHIGLQVETQQELFGRLESLKARGVMIDEEEIGTACCYAIQDKFWVNDPDGHEWEVYYFHKDVEFNDPRYANEEASACCTPASASKPKVSLQEIGQSAKACC